MSRAFKPKVQEYIIRIDWTIEDKGIDLSGLSLHTVILILFISKKNL